MQPQRYEFSTIFDNPSAGVLVPKFNVVIGLARYNAGIPITLSTQTMGLNLFNYIGRPIAGQWDGVTRTLTIQGFI